MEDKSIKIGIYDRYLATAGGGERYSCKMAEILARQPLYKVELITDIFVEIKKVESRLNLDLSKVGLKIFPFLSEEYAKKITSSYNIFINCTYLSSLPGYGASNIYLCYFPTRFDVDFKLLHRVLLLFFRLPAIWLYRLADRISGSFKSMEVVEGIYDIKRFLLLRGSWISGNAVIDYKAGMDKIRIGVKNPVSTGVALMNCRIILYMKQRQEKMHLLFEQQIMLEAGARQAVIIEIPEAARSWDLRLIIQSDTFNPVQTNTGGGNSRKLGAVVYNEQKVNLLKKLLLKIVGFIPLFLVTYPKDLKFLETYNRIISISEYSRKYIEKSWQKKSTILFPPVETDDFKSDLKDKIILSVGRFFPEHHNKKQLELAKIFIEIFKDYPETMSGYTLCLAGGVEQKTEHLKYVAEIEDVCRGYPVKIMTNLGWDDLVSLFSKALIFWHASGMGEDEESHPEKFEHFGITTVEAMASGCIPVVINRGGQTEIIENGFNGFLFDSWEQLKALTLEVCRHYDTGLYNKISANAISSSGKFSSGNFESRLLDIIKEEAQKI